MPSLMKTRKAYLKGFGDDIRMDFGLDKCAKATFKRGKLAKTENIELDVGTTIQDLEQEGTYKYLGVNEGDGIQHAKMKEKIQRSITVEFAWCSNPNLMLSTELTQSTLLPSQSSLIVSTS